MSHDQAESGALFILKPDEVQPVLLELRMFAEKTWNTDWLTTPGTKPNQISTSTWLEMTRHVFLRSQPLQILVKQSLSQQVLRVKGEELWTVCRASPATTEKLIKTVSKKVHLTTPEFTLGARMLPKVTTTGN
jgi:hypothetical protein